MDHPHDIPVRAARDRLIDLLGIGDTYPLTDLSLTVVPPKVVFGDTAQVTIADAQIGVDYQLFDAADAPVGLARGEGGRLAITTPPLRENVSFRVRARKLPVQSSLPAQAARLLDAPAQVKVGLDTTLLVRFQDSPALPLLDPDKRDPQPADPRLVDWGASLGVEIDKSQEGVDYTLVLDGRDAGGAVRTGNRQTISLPVGPVREDLLIQVRATKRFGATLQQETALLDASLQLKVMADPACAVAADGPGIVDHRQPAAIRVGNTQASVFYRAFAGSIADSALVHDDAAGPDTVVVAVAGQADVRVVPPPWRRGWVLPDGFAAVGDAALPGNGGDLLLPLPPLTADTLVIVQALKHHALAAAPPVSASVASALRLQQAAVVLVRPDPLRALTLRVTLAGGQTGNSLQVCGGEPGVYYHCQLVPAGQHLALPAYVHQRDVQDPTQNKGIGQLRVEVDFSLASYGDDATPGMADPATHVPQPPLLDIPALPVGTRLSLRAVRAQTALSAVMAEQAVLAEVAELRADPAAVEMGATARILIAASDPQDVFQLLQDGQPVVGAQAQGGGALALTTGPLQADSRCALRVTRGPAGGLQVERLVAVDVSVLPENATNAATNATTTTAAGAPAPDAAAGPSV